MYRLIVLRVCSEFDMLNHPEIVHKSPAHPVSPVTLSVTKYKTRASRCKAAESSVGAKVDGVAERDIQKLGL